MVAGLVEEEREESSCDDEEEDDWMVLFRKRNVFNHWGIPTDPRGDDVWADCAEGAD